MGLEWNFSDVEAFLCAQLNLFAIRWRHLAGVDGCGCEEQCDHVLGGWRIFA